MSLSSIASSINRALVPAEKIIGYSNPLTAIPTFAADATGQLSKAGGYVAGAVNHATSSPAPAPKPAPKDTYQAPTGGGAAPDNTDYSSYSGGYTGGGSTTGGQSAADYQAQQDALMQIDQGLNGANDALGRLDNQQNIGMGNVGRDYQAAYDTLFGQQQIADRNYNQNRTGQLNEYLSNKNNIASNAQSWLDAARRTLGAQGAGGGSAARYGVPNQANQMVASGDAQATQTNNKNITALDQGYQDDKNKFGNSFSDLLRQKTQGENDLRSKIEGQRADLLNTIGSLTGQRSIANGGDYRSALAAASPYTSRIPAILQAIDGLSATPNITAQQVQTSAPSLQGYNWANPNAPTVAPQDPTLQNNNVPIIPEDQRKKNQIFSLFGLDPNQLQTA